jgi:hypothetical protein
MLSKVESFEVHCLSCEKSLNNYENKQKLETIEEKINKFMGKEQESNEIKLLIKNEEFKFKRSLFLDKTIDFLKNLNNNQFIIINDEYFSQNCLESLNQEKDIMLNIYQMKVLILKQAIKNFTNNYLIELCLEINSLEEINFEHHKILSIEDSTFILDSITDKNGCKGTSTATLTDLSLPITISALKTDVLCQGTSTGTASMIVSGGVTPYSFLWSSNAGSATTASLSNLPAGSYNVTVTEGSSSKCKVVGTVEIIEPTFGIQTSITVKENSGILPDDGIICQNDEAELTVNAKTFSGGAISSYRWSDASGNNTNTSSND